MTDQVNHDEALMRAAIQQGKESVAAGNHPFGAVLSMGKGNSDVVLKAQNTVVTDKDCTCHAELNLVRASTKRYTFDELAKSTLTTSTEPCAMCAGAIYWSGIGRVVYGCSGALLGDIAGEELDVSCRTVLSSGRLRKVEVVGPVLQEEAAEDHRTFWKDWDGTHS
eukprot:m.9009 g.9009  ORF g.9009 m.9009 type:complete len:166 (-) comp3994_c0_seq1:6605-7102(-)